MLHSEVFDALTKDCELTGLLTAGTLHSVGAVLDRVFFPVFVCVNECVCVGVCV